MDFSISPYAPGREMPLYNFGSQESDEERRRKELQARMDQQARVAAMSDEAVASGGGVAPVEPTPIKETRTIDPVTGEVQLTIKGSERDLSSANPNTPTYSGAAKPVAPGADMAAYTAQQESGANPNIGYHFAPDATGQRKSTAFGTYGLTAPAYQDVQRANPAFANRPITSLTPDEQTAAFNTYTGLNAQRLKGLGVEPTQGNVQLAHLLGPSGAARFLQTGEVSEAAAAANGGVENLKRIAQGRLAGSQAPSSGAAPLVPQAQPAPGVAVATGQGVQGTMTTPVAPEAPLPANQGIKIPGLPSLSQMAQQPAAEGGTTPLQAGIQRFQENQDNLDELVKMRNDQSIPEHLRQRAGTRAYELMNNQYRTQQAQDKLNELIASGDQNAIARAMTSKPRDEEGSWLKMIALGFISPQLAGAEAIKLGLAPTKWEGAVITDRDGNDIGVEVQRRVDGKILGGTRSDGTPLTADELNQVTGIAQNVKTLATQANQSATHEMDRMRKANALARESKLPLPFTEDEIVQRGKDVYRQTMAVSRAAPLGANRPAVGGAATAATTTTAAPTAKVGVLENWTTQRPGEDMKAYAKRQQIRPEDVESAAQQLAEGRIKPSDLGYKPEFRNIAVQRAEELTGKTYSPMRYDQVKKVVERYTSGEDHKTLVNIGTAANHLIAFREAAMSVPEGQRTDVSAWNSFAQKYSKFINAPEVKNKEAMAEFVAGEMVKAATGTGGGVAERLALEKKLLAANTPAEWNAVINGQLELAHGRYGELKSSYERSTGRKDFDQTVGVGGEAAKEFGKIEAVKAAKTGSYSDADKEARYQEWKRKQGTK